MDPEVAQVAMSIKYVTVISTIIVLWDHILTFTEEAAFIWKGPITKAKAFFVVQRYGAALVFIIITYLIFGIRTVGDQVGLCQVLTTVVMAFVLWMQAYMNYVMVSRLYALWDYRKGVISALVILCCLVSAASIAMALVNSLELIRTVTPEPSYFHMCMYPVRPRSWAGDYGCQCVFDIFTLALTAFSSKTRPLRIQVELITEFLLEGLLMHLVCISRIHHWVYSRIFNLTAQLLFGDCSCLESHVLLLSVVCTVAVRLLNVILALTPNKPGLFVIALP
ncbi:hypothetical protein BC834DRAFT_908492 [Gloeopeniophorella convolvens]|nr:hypothetical protein BC834DRAFT_908492 [Gloeopeniophorella convolvens]